MRRTASVPPTASTRQPSTVTDTLGRGVRSEDALAVWSEHRTQGCRERIGHRAERRTAIADGEAELPHCPLDRNRTGRCKEACKQWRERQVQLGRASDVAGLIRIEHCPQLSAAQVCRDADETVAAHCKRRQEQMVVAAPETEPGAPLAQDG